MGAISLSLDTLLSCSKCHKQSFAPPGVTRETKFICRSCTPAAEEDRALHFDRWQCDPALRPGGQHGELRKIVDGDEIGAVGGQKKARTSKREWPEWTANRNFTVFLSLQGTRNIARAALRHEALRLTSGGGLTDAQAAELLGVSAKQVERMVSRLLAKGEALWLSFKENPVDAKIAAGNRVRLSKRYFRAVMMPPGHALWHTSTITEEVLESAYLFGGNAQVREFIEHFRHSSLADRIREVPETRVIPKTCEINGEFPATYRGIAA